MHPHYTSHTRGNPPCDRLPSPSAVTPTASSDSSGIPSHQGHHSHNFPVYTYSGCYLNSRLFAYFLPPCEDDVKAKEPQCSEPQLYLPFISRKDSA